MSGPASIVDSYTTFNGGERLISGGELLNMANSLQSARIAITAVAGGGQTSATKLVAAFNRVDTCATASDSVQLPPAIPGRSVCIYNNTAATLAVFGSPTNNLTGVGDTIAASNSNTQQATGTGVTQATTTMMLYSCFKAGEWKQGSMA